jgi:predicted esterase
VLLGHSDGASYALSLGLANSDVFRSIVALSPGFVKLPARFEAGQRIFIAHGTRDSVIPMEVARRIADTLSSNELSVRFRSFDGGHGLSRPVLLEGLDSALPKSNGKTERSLGSTPSTL